MQIEVHIEGLINPSVEEQDDLDALKRMVKNYYVKMNSLPPVGCKFMIKTLEKKIYQLQTMLVDYDIHLIFKQ